MENRVIGEKEKRKTIRRRQETRNKTILEKRGRRKDERLANKSMLAFKDS